MNDKTVESLLKSIEAMSSIAASDASDKVRILKIIKILVDQMVDLEREECAKECHEVAKYYSDDSIGIVVASQCALNIRKRKYNYLDEAMIETSA